MSLWSDFLTNDGRMIHKWKHYFVAYERHFERFRNQAVTVVEIGCGAGGSLQLWKRFFGPYARIIGLDINPHFVAYEEDQIQVRIGDQKDPAFLGGVVDEFGAPDIVIDDGSHMMTDVLASFQVLFPALSSMGVYLVEDLHTAYWPEFGGGLAAQGSFIEHSKALIDKLNADHTRGRVTPDSYTRSMLSLHFYDSIVVIEKGRRPPNQSFLMPTR
jgi:cephalosporin hydroxylase